MEIVLLGCLGRHGALYFTIVLAWTALVSGPNGGDRRLLPLSGVFFLSFLYNNDVRDEDIDISMDDFFCCPQELFLFLFLFPFSFLFLITTPIELAFQVCMYYTYTLFHVVRTTNSALAARIVGRQAFCMYH